MFYYFYFYFLFTGASDDPSSLDPREARELAAAVKSLRGASTLEQVARLDTCVTVVDAAAFNGDLASPADLLERFGARESGGEAADSDADRSVAQLLVSQIEFADLIVLNKCDLVSRADVLALKSALTQLNPGAEIILATRADAPLNKLLCTNRHDPDAASNAAGWLRTLQSKHQRVVQTKEYGICNFVYKSRTPFHPARLRAFLHEFAAVLDLDEGDEDGDEEEVFDMDTTWKTTWMTLTTILTTLNGMGTPWRCHWSTERRRRMPNSRLLAIYTA